jgi:hypothetical protein
MEFASKLAPTQQRIMEFASKLAPTQERHNAINCGVDAAYVAMRPDTRLLDLV